MFTRSRRHRLRPFRKPSLQPILEDLENRLILSILLPIFSHGHHEPGVKPTGNTVPLDFGSPTPVGYTPAQLDTAYDINKITFGSIEGDGAGQTIAIVDAYDDPAFVNSTDPNFSTSDLAEFDQTFGLPDPPSFTKFNEYGQTTDLPGTDPAGAGNASGNWEMEEALDVEWAHAIAPAASIDLLEANTDTNNNDLFTAVATAAALPGVLVVSMSWGIDEYQGEQAIDSTFVTPSGHQGVTFIAAAGDQGSPGYYPAYSPNVVAAGGTTLLLTANNSVQSETAWSGSGGGTSAYEPEPAYQEGVQSTGMRTIPDVAWDADPNTGVAVYDSYDNTDGSGPWVDIGGTSVASPSWAGLIAIANQGRVLEGASTLDGPTQTLPALYAAPSTDFNDITSGSNGGFNASPGYDEVTGLGTPKANLLIPSLVAYGAASKIVVTAQPPPSVIAGAEFGVVVSAENVQGYVDPSFDGTMTIALDATNGASLGGTLTVTASHGEAIFDGLTLNQLGNGYYFTVTSSAFGSITTDTFDVIANPTPNSATFYPVPTDASLRGDIAAADSNGDASNTIILSTATYVLTDTTTGQIVIQNSSSLAAKTLNIVGQGETSSIIEPGTYPWNDRLFEVIGTSPTNMSVVFQGLTIEGGNATGGGILGGNAALGGGVLIDGGTVAMTGVALAKDQAVGAAGGDGASAAKSHAAGDGGTGKTGLGGGIYLAAGTLTLIDDTFSADFAIGGSGGAGGGNKEAGSGAAGVGGAGNSAAGGGVYVAGGTVLGSRDAFSGNGAIGGKGGKGGAGGLGSAGNGGGDGGDGGPGGSAAGGAIYLAQGSITLAGSSLKGNTAIGGAGGLGGDGGAGSALVASSIGLTGLTPSGLGGSGSPSKSILSSILNGGTALTGLLHGGPGGAGGLGGAGGAGNGGGVYVGGGSLSLATTTVSGNPAVGGQGGTGGIGGHAAMGLGDLGGLGGFGGSSSLFGSGSGGKGGSVPLGGSGGLGGDGGTGSGGGLYLAAGTVTLNADTFSGNSATGGKGGTGGTGGPGGFAGGLSGIGTGSGGGGTGTGSQARKHHHDNPLTAGGGSTPSLGGGSKGGGAASGGPGGDGGDGGMGQGGALYISGGTITLFNDTVAVNAANGGAGGTGGAGGSGGSNGLGKGAAGPVGQAGESDGGALYVEGGAVDLFNSTVALNTPNGVVQVKGTVTATSTLFAGNGTVDYSGNIDATNSLFQTAPIDGSATGENNLIGVDPLLATAGLADNGGPTQTIALQSNSPAIGAGSNPDHLFTDQRGYGPRTGPGGTDIGAYQHDASADTTPPTATLNATGVTSTNAASLNPYTFTVTYEANLAVAASSLGGAVVDVSLPGGGVPIAATATSTQPVGPTDSSGDAQGFVVTYAIAPPGGAWSAADNGTYTVDLAGTPVTDLSGNAVAAGNLGTFSVQIATPTQLVVTGLPTSPVTAGATFVVTVSLENAQGQVQTGFSGSVTIALTPSSSGAKLGGTLTAPVSQGVARFSDLTLDQAGSGYALQLTSSGLPAVTSNTFTVSPATASQLVVTNQPTSPVTTSESFVLAVSVEDRFGNLVPNYSGTLTAALGVNPSGAALGGTLTAPVSQGVATFSGLTLDQAGSGYTLQVTANGLTTATSNTVTVTTSGGSQTVHPTQLVVTTQPTSPVTAGAAFVVTVSLENAQGQVQPASSGSVTIALTSSSSGAKLGGTLTVDVSQGVATFSGLTLDQAGTGYTLQVTAAGLPAITSAPFAVTASTGGQSGSGNPSGGSSGTGSTGTTTTGTTTTGTTTSGSGTTTSKSHEKKHHKSSGTSHKSSHPTKPVGHKTRPVGHKTKAVGHKTRLDIRDHPLLRRNLSPP